MTEPKLQQLNTGELTLSYFEWGGAQQPTVLLIHATGFHARCWDQVVARLPKNLHILAVDMRGHGRSEKVAPYGWDDFGRDLDAFTTQLKLQDVIGVGHSMGGHCVTQVAARQPGLFRQLVLLDPVIFEPQAYVDNRYRGYADASEHPVARRRNQWDSWQQMQASLQGKGSFGLWDPAVLQDYCRYGVQPSVTGSGVSLACPPEVEANVYLGNTETDIYPLLPQVSCPVTVLRAPPRDPDNSVAMDFSKSPTDPGVAGCFPNGSDVLLEQLTHFIPMQDPQLVADYIIETL